MYHSTVAVEANKHLGLAENMQTGALNAVHGWGKCAQCSAMQSIVGGWVVWTSCIRRGPFGRRRTRLALASCSPAACCRLPARWPGPRPRPAWPLSQPRRLPSSGTAPPPAPRQALSFQTTGSWALGLTAITADSVRSTTWSLIQALRRSTNVPVEHTTSTGGRGQTAVAASGQLH